MNKLKRYRFSDLYEMSSGISTTKEQAGSGSPFASFRTVFNNYFLPDELPDLMNTSLEEQEKYSIKKGDILVTRTSETIDELAMSCVAIKDYPHATYSGFTKRLRPKTINIAYDKYMAFFLRSKYFRRVIDSNTIMTLRASFNETIFSFLDLYLPDYEQQVKIGNLLYTIEKKIQLNRRINDNLEKQAKLIYDYWFNQFNFPDKNGRPYKTSGGKMVWNEKLRREIPDGWEVKTLREVILNEKNGDWGNDSSKRDSDIKVKCFRGADFATISQEHQITAPTRYINNTHADRLLSNGDLVIEVSGGSPTQSTGRIGYICNAFIERCGGSVCCSNFCKAFTPLTLNHQFWLYHTWKSLYDCGWMFNFEGKTTGIKNLLFDTLINSVKIAVPNTLLLKDFNDFCSCLYTQIQQNLIENKNLSAIRDFLLPMLMNGQSVVGD